LIAGKDSGIPTVMGRTENDVTDERIVHILNEASQMMKPNQQQDDTQSNDESTSPNQLIVIIIYYFFIFLCLFVLILIIFYRVLPRPDKDLKKIYHKNK